MNELNFRIKFKIHLNLEFTEAMPIQTLAGNFNFSFRRTYFDSVKDLNPGFYKGGNK